MQSVKQVKNRISSVRSTRQLTATVKVVALAKFKKQHKRLLQATPYLTEMDRMMRRLIRSVSVRQEQVKTPVFPNFLNNLGSITNFDFTMLYKIFSLAATVILSKKSLAS